MNIFPTIFDNDDSQDDVCISFMLSVYCRQKSTKDDDIIWPYLRLTHQTHTHTIFNLFSNEKRYRKLLIIYPFHASSSAKMDNWTI